MFPLYDENPTAFIPFVTLALMVACVAVWVYVQGAGLSVGLLESSVCAFGAIPAEITGVRSPGVAPGAPAPCTGGGLAWAGLATSLFLHGGWLHLIGNLWFLWIFGNNVEDSMGHLRFLAFYLLAGLLAAGAHVLSEPASPIPMVGASGAISAIMGAYLLVYPRNRVYTLFVLIVFVRVLPLPAWLFLGYWFLLQLAASSLHPPGSAGGVAFWAHIAGFLAGVALVPLFVNRGRVQARRSRVRVVSQRGRSREWW